ncbi:hypothetical protein V6N13_092834 [Hibiscus sabdariffa]|uniref:Uncharacterized protein n=2 Tax=Hibiscus sabdariffa TaxID=183260 RepID=A0ABR2P815_9ROSI
MAMRGNHELVCLIRARPREWSLLPQHNVHGANIITRHAITEKQPEISFEQNPGASQAFTGHHQTSRANCFQTPFARGHADKTTHALPVHTAPISSIGLANTCMSMINSPSMNFDV